MADVITRLKVDSTEYDSKIKRATQGLLAMEQSFRKAGTGLDVMLKDEREFVASLGKMETVSNTAKGRLNELTQAFTELSIQYKRLTDEEKKGDFGKALSSSLEQLKGRINDAKNELADVEKELKGVDDSAGGMGEGMKTALAVMGGNLMTKAVSLAADLGAKAMDVANQSARMASAAEGVRLAFERIDDGSLLDKLREATHGTVNDLELMKAAVKFNDFKLPLDQLGTMLAFAQQKAKDTGQSVDYLVDSIVMGLGRQSLMILDNLGLSAAEIKARMAETGDMTTAVGEIIREQMQSAGDYVETAADRTQKATAEMENAMLDLGVAIQNTFNISGGVEGFETFLRTDLARTMTDVVNWLGEVKTAITEIGTSDGFEAMCNVLDSLVIPKLTGITTQLRNIKAFIDGLTGSGSGNMSMSGIAQSFRNSLNQVRERVKSALPTYTVKTDAEGNVISATNTKGKDVTEQYKKNLEDAHSVDNLIKKLRELEEERRKAITAGQSDVAKDLLKQINQTKQEITGLDPNALKTNKPSTTTNKKNAWALIDMGSYDFSQISLGRSIADVQKNLASAQKQYNEAGDAFGRASALAMIEKFQQEMEAMKSVGSPFADAYSHDFNKDMKRLSEDLPSRGVSKGDKEFEKTAGTISDMSGSLSQIAGGIQQLGIDLPEGLANTLTAIQGVSTILTGIAAVVTIIQTLTAISTARSMIPFFSNGGVVHAAEGWSGVVPGSRFSGDQVPALLNSQELVLNTAQTGRLASALQGAQSGNGGTPYVDGEKIYLGVNNYLRRSGKGEIVTAR